MLFGRTELSGPGDILRFNGQQKAAAGGKAAEQSATSQIGTVRSDMRQNRIETCSRDVSMLSETSVVFIQTDMKDENLARYALVYTTERIIQIEVAKRPSSRNVNRFESNKMPQMIERFQP